ncbi:MAG TPA: hypothetical protein VIH71_10810 [Solirubrobacteraceae bacterium]
MNVVRLLQGEYDAPKDRCGHRGLAGDRYKNGHKDSGDENSGAKEQGHGMEQGTKAQVCR